MRAEDAYWVFILVDVEHKVSIVLLVSLKRLLFVYLGVSPAILHVSIGDDFYLGDSFLKKVVSHLKVAYEVIRICLDGVYFAVIFDKALREDDFALFGCVAGWDVINRLNGCDSAVCIVDVECFNAIVGLFFK